jgi:hypothetical protein
MTDAGHGASRAISWEYGVMSVERRGAMLAPALFVLPDGRQVAPFQVAPWFSEPAAQAMPGLMPRLRGDWPCIPFGFDIDRDPLGDWPSSQAAGAIDEGHGFGANHDWTFAEDRLGALSLFIDYPQTHPIARLERRILPDPGGPAIDVELTVHPRRDCRLPVGVHPTFRLPSAPGAFEIALDARTEIATFPGELDASAIFLPGQFAAISSVPLKRGGALDIRRLPFAENAEELVQALDAAGSVVLRNHHEGYAVRLSWNADDFPSLLLWLSNRGRTFEPWRGRHLALGVEPVCSAFDLGAAISGTANPLNARDVRTVHAFRAGMAWTTRYRFAVEALDEGRC